jgi:hypothetical protein
MKIIYETTYGSHLYGTNLEISDYDTVQVFVPKVDELILQKTEAFLSSHIITDRGEDVTQHPVAKIVRNAASGNFTAIEILFSTPYTMKKGGVISKEWKNIWLNRANFLTRANKSFLGYCLSQAKKYDHRGEKKRVVDEIYDYMNVLGCNDIKGQTIAPHTALLHEIKRIGGHEVSFMGIPQTSEEIVNHLVICGKKIPTTGHIGLIYEVLDRLLETWGGRTAEAARNNGVDWKGMMHAVRIADEAIEYFNTGSIEFPRRNAEFLKKIRKGNIDYNEVSDLIDKLLLDAEAASKVSSLKETVDSAFIDSLLLDIYKGENLRD